MSFHDISRYLIYTQPRFGACLRKPSIFFRCEDRSKDIPDVTEPAGETCQVQVEREANGATEVVEEELPFSVLISEFPTFFFFHF